MPVAGEGIMSLRFGKEAVDDLRVSVGFGFASGFVNARRVWSEEDDDDDDSDVDKNVMKKGVSSPSNGATFPSVVLPKNL